MKTTRKRRPRIDEATRVLTRELELLSLEKRIEKLALGFAKDIARAAAREANLLLRKEKAKRRPKRRRRAKPPSIDAEIETGGW